MNLNLERKPAQSEGADDNGDQLNHSLLVGQGV